MQENELEKALKDIKIIQSEKNILEVKKKQLQEDLDKYYKMSTEQEEKNQKQEILIVSLQKQIIDLQQSQFGNYQNNNLEDSTFFRNSRNQSQQFSKDLNSELPQLSHRGQTNELETIQECSMIQEMSAQHSRQVTTIPDQFVNQFDPFELQQSRISLDKSQNKPNVLEKQENLEINEKAKPIEELNKIQVPPIVVPLPEVKEETKTQNNEQKNDMDLYRRITYPNQQNNQNIFKEIYKADFDEYSKMKQNQRRLTTEFNKCVLQRTNFKTKLTLRDPYEEFFNLLCQCVKLNSECFGDVYYINTEKYYQECKKTGGPFNHWEDWIKKKFQDHIAQHTSV